MDRAQDIVARLLNRGVVILCGPPADTGPLVPLIALALQARQADMERTSAVRAVALGSERLSVDGEPNHHVTLLVEGLDDIGELTVVERQKRLDAFATLVEDVDPHATAVIATVRAERVDALHGHARLQTILDHALYPVGARNSGVVPKPEKRAAPAPPPAPRPERGRPGIAIALAVVLGLAAVAATWRAFDAQREANVERAASRAAKIAARDALASEALALTEIPARKDEAPIAALRALAIDREILAPADARVQLALDTAMNAILPARVVVGEGLAVSDARWLPSGDLLVVAPSLLYLVDGATGRRTTEVRPAGETLFAAARVYGATGIAAGRRGEVVFFDAKTGAIRETITDLADQEHDVTLAEHAPRALACLHGRCTVIDADGTRTPLGPADVVKTAFSSDGKGAAFATLTGPWSIWSADRKTMITGDAGTGKSARFTFDDTTLLVAGENALELHGLSGRLRGKLDLDFSAVSADGRRLRLKDRAHPERVHFCDGRNGHTFATITTAATNHVLSPDGKLDAIWSDSDQVVSLFDTSTGAVRMTVRGHAGVIASVVWSGSSALVATASDDRTIRLWDASRGGALVAQRTTEQTPGAVYLSVDGTRLLETTLVGPALVWWNLSPDDARKAACVLAKDDLTLRATVCP